MKLKRFKQFLNEKMDNLFTTDQKQRYAQQVWDILQTSYKQAGGIHGSGFKNIEDMINNIPFWKISRTGDTVKAVVMYKEKLGRKSVAGGTDGTPEGKEALAKMKEDELKTGRSFGEISDAALLFNIKKLGYKFIEYIVPFKEAKEKLFKLGDDAKKLDHATEKHLTHFLQNFLYDSKADKLGFSDDQKETMIYSIVSNSYLRDIGGSLHAKIMIGNIEASTIKPK